MKVSDIEVTLIDHCGSDLSVVNAARVSFNKESHEFTDKDNKLIRYLAQHKHFSPFNHCFISVRVKAPVFVARQLVKHKFMPWNEQSRRYVDDEPEFYFPDYWRKKADNVKQGSSEEAAYMMRDLHGEDWLVKDVIQDFTKDCLYVYQSAVNAGVCPEQARMVLPQNTMTEWIWSGTLGAFCDMLRLRLDSHTQKETQIVANKVKEIILPLFPVAVKELLDV